MFLTGICTASTPFVLLGDVLDCLPLDQCDKIFTFVEKNVATWKSVGIDRVELKILCHQLSLFLC